METKLSDRVKYESWVLTLCMVARLYSFTKFSRFHKIQSGNMCNVDHKGYPKRRIQGRR